MTGRTFSIKNPVYIESGFTIVGPKESDGNFGGSFDVVLKNDLWCEKSYEKCECKMHKNAVSGAIMKAGLSVDDVDIQLSGDLLNEISASNLAARSFPFGFLGLFNACSTFGEAIIVGSMLIDGGFAHRVACSTSSHFSTAERQYRFPLELGNQRKPTAQWTVTGAGCTILSDKKPHRTWRRVDIGQMLEHDTRTVSDEKERKRLQKRADKLIECVSDVSRISSGEERTATHTVRITGGTIGKVIDLGIDDEANMGAAMAPAACDTIITHLKDTGRSLDYYDGIYTGDLGRFGMEALTYLLKREGIDMPDRYMDCGASYFKPEQKTFQGGSGTGCVNTAFNGYILDMLRKGGKRRILVVPTGALLNKDTPLQKETIPGIAHAFVAESEEYDMESTIENNENDNTLRDRT